MIKLPDETLHLFDEPNFAHLATLMPDGSPHSSVLWVDREVDTILLNTVKGRVKHRNILRDPRVSLSVHNRDFAEEYVHVRGTAELIDEGANEHIDRLARKYLGVDAFPTRPGMERIMIRVIPEKVFYKAE